MKSNKTKLLVEKNIPVPKKGSKYPFESMEVGDSFFTAAPRVNVYSASRQYVKKHGNEKNFIARVENNGIRIWRIK